MKKDLSNKNYKFSCLITYYILNTEFFRSIAQDYKLNSILNTGIEQSVQKVLKISYFINKKTKIKIIKNVLKNYIRFL